MSANITKNLMPEYVRFNSYEGKLMSVCNGINWHPQKGDYYTAARVDLELYLIVNEDDEHFYTIYCTQPDAVEKWRKDEFLDPNGFMHYRRYVSDFVLDTYCDKILETIHVG